MAATEPSAPPTSRRGEILMILGAIILFVGPMLTFATVGLTDAGEGFDIDFGDVVGAQSGYQLEEGSTYVLFGAIALIMGIALWFARGTTARKVLSVIGFLAAAVALAAGFIDLTGVGDIAGASQGLLEATAGLGIWIVILGALVALVGSVIAFRTAPPSPAATPVAPPPAA